MTDNQDVKLSDIIYQSDAPSSTDPKSAFSLLGSRFSIVLFLIVTLSVFWMLRRKKNTPVEPKYDIHAGVTKIDVKTISIEETRKIMRKRFH